MIFLATFLATRFKLPEYTAKLIAYGLTFLLGLILLSIIVLGIRSCYVSYKQEQVRDDLTDIRQDQSNVKTDGQVAEKQIEQADEQVTIRKVEAVKAKEKLEEVKKKDSSLESGEAKKALDRYCTYYDDPPICGKR